MASQITGYSLVCPIVCSSEEQRNFKGSRYWLVMRDQYFTCVLPVVFLQKNPVMRKVRPYHDLYDDVIMSAMASQITSLTIVYSTVYSGANQSEHQSSASLAFVWGIHRGPVNSPHKWPVTRKMFPFDDVIMTPSWKWKGPVYEVGSIVHLA